MASCHLRMTLVVVLISFRSSSGVLTAPVLPLRGEWVRYRTNFKDFAIGHNAQSAAALDGAPQAIFYPNTVDEVQWFSQTFHESVGFSVRSGGHSYEGLSTTPCSVTIDTSRLDAIAVDRRQDGTFVTVGAGVRHEELYERLAEQSLGVPGAKCHEVGFMGCTLGGCHGFLSAAYGLASDNVQSLNIVLANSTALTVSPEEHPELFWALRGAGGGDFGVVTSVEVQARRVEEVFAYEFVWDLSEEVGTASTIAAIINNWQTWADNLPQNMSAFLNCTASGICTARGVYHGSRTSDARNAANRLPLGAPRVPDSTMGLEPYSEVSTRWNDCVQSEQYLARKVKSLYYPGAIEDAVIEQGVVVLQQARFTLGHEAAAITYSRVGFGSSGLGFGIGSAADLYHSSRFLVELSASWQVWESGEARKSNLDWIRQLQVAMSPGSHGSYRNYEDLDMGASWFTYQNRQNHPAAPYYLEAALYKLELVKATYDKTSVFHHPLSASFSAATMEAFQLQCQGRQWPTGPELEPATVITRPPAQALFGSYSVDGETTVQPGQVSEQAKHLSHIVFDAVEVLEEGSLNLDAGRREQIRLFASQAREHHSRIKVMMSIGGARTNATVWATVARSSGLRNQLAAAVRSELDELELDGVDVSWQVPQPEDRMHLVEAVRAVKAALGPEHVLTLQGEVMRAEAVQAAYDVKMLASMVDYVLLRAHDFGRLDAGAHLEHLTHLNANLYSANPTLASAAGGVVNWIGAGAPREKLVLGVATYGAAYDTVGAPPGSEGQLDWRVMRRSRAFTALSQEEGMAAWVEVREVLNAAWSTFVSREVEALGGAAAWSEALGVWVGYDSPQTVRQKATWVREMGLGGGMIGPLHMDTFGDDAESLVEAYVEALEVVIQLDPWTVDVLTISLACGLPVLFLACCVQGQLNRWHDIRKMHDGLAMVSAEPWNSKSRPLRSDLEEGADEEDEFGRSASQALSSFPPPRSPTGRRSSIRVMSEMMASAGRILRRSSQASRPAETPRGRAASYLGRAHSVRSVASGGANSVQNAFDDAMRRGAASDMDHLVRIRHEQAALDAQLVGLSDEELGRKLSLLKKVNLRKQHGRALPVHLQKEDGYEAQRGVVRYSRLLARDAVDWIENCDNEYLSLYETKQRGLVKLFCVCTMYAETPDLLERSLRGIAHGIHQLSTESDFLRHWDEAVVCIVCDGLAKIPEETKEYLEEQGVFAPSLIDDARKLDGAVEGEAPEVALHVFEGLMQFEDWVPTQTVLMIKQENAGKLDSQRWAFTGLAERLMPVMPEQLRQSGQHDEDRRKAIDSLTFDDLRALDRYLICLDAGTKPLTNSLVELVKPMRYDPSIAGTCGHMVPDRTLGNPLVMSQVFEYEHGHIIDKSMEAMFGFITVLPGAYSAYRFDSVRRDQWIKGTYRRVGPLVEYFKQLAIPADSPALLNMGLAEDRWLCFALMCQEDRGHSLWYCRKAGAVTDVPDTLQTFLQQRRRWNNGAFFTRLFVMRQFLDMFHETNHSIVKKCGFMFQFLQMLFDTVFVWFAAALFYLWISFNVEQIGSRTIANAMGPWFLVLYLLAVVAHYDRRVAEIKWVHRLIAYSLGLEITFCIGVFAYDQTTSTNWQVTVLVTFSLACSLFMSFLQGRFLKVLSMLGGYLLLYPTYAVLAQLYGFCHVHDVSWGTKGIESAHGEKVSKEKEEKVRLALSSFRFRVLVLFIISNFLFGYIVGFFNQQATVLLPLFVGIVFFNVLRALGSFAFTIVNWIDEALQITALGEPVRSFGEDYELTQEQVQHINAIDVRHSNKVYHLLRKRAHRKQIERQEQRRKSLAITPPPLQLSNYFEKEGPMSPTASTEEEFEYDSFPVQPGGHPPVVITEGVDPFHPSEARMTSGLLGRRIDSTSVAHNSPAIRSVRQTAGVRYLDQQAVAACDDPVLKRDLDQQAGMTPPDMPGGGDSLEGRQEPPGSVTDIPASPFAVELYAAGAAGPPSNPPPLSAFEVARKPGILRVSSLTGASERTGPTN